MLKDGYDMMVAKYSGDARDEIKVREDEVRQVRQRRILFESVQRWLKRIFLMIALIGVGVGLFYGHELGLMMGEAHYSSSAETDPSLRGVPEENAKRVRKMKELREKRDADLGEVNQMLDGDAQ